jgi:hypothetical protein
MGIGEKQILYCPIKANNNFVKNTDMINDLSQNILSTIIYYDILDYPMTSFEIWKYLIAQNNDKEIKLVDIIEELENEEIKKYVEKYHGFYFLKNRERLVAQRIERNKISQEKFKIINRAVFWLKFTPFLKMIGITGRMAMKNAETKSDLDFLVILKSGKIFTGRLFFTLITQLLGLRRHGRKITNRICLNYFIADESSEIISKDLYSSSEYYFMLPVFGREVFKNFQKRNSWITGYKPNYSLNSADNLKLISDSPMAKIIRKIGEAVFSFNFIEDYLRKWQMERIVNDPRTHQKGSAVMAGDEALVFLPVPQGPEIYEKFQKKIEEMKI